LNSLTICPQSLIFVCQFNQRVKLFFLNFGNFVFFIFYSKIYLCAFWMEWRNELGGGNPLENMLLGFISRSIYPNISFIISPSFLSWFILFTISLFGFWDYCISKLLFLIYSSFSFNNLSCSFWMVEDWELIFLD